MQTEQSGDYEIRHYLAIVWRWLWLIALVTALAAGAAFIVSRRSTPIYEASATLLINEGQQATGPEYDSLLLNERLAHTYAKMLKARPLLDTAAAQLGTPISGSGITVEPVRDTQLIHLKARHSDPAVAANIANTLVKLFIEHNTALRATRVTESQERLRQEMAAVEADIDATQLGLTAERAKFAPDAIQIARLEGLLAQQRAIHSDLFLSYEELRAAHAREASSLVVVEPAVPPLGPVLPRTLMNTLLAGALGGVFALGVSFVAEYLDDTVRKPDDVERVGHLPTLATVHRFTDHKAGGVRPLMTALPDTAAAEAYRLLRTNLQFATLGRGHGAVTLMVTSANPQAARACCWSTPTCAAPRCTTSSICPTRPA